MIQNKLIIYIVIQVLLCLRTVLKHKEGMQSITKKLALVMDGMNRMVVGPSHLNVLEQFIMMNANMLGVIQFTYLDSMMYRKKA